MEKEKPVEKDKPKAGDVVQLKSGGPEMTVNDITYVSTSEGSIPWASCVWFDGCAHRTATFAAAALKPAVARS